jgi:hypothetical protein
VTKDENQKNDLRLFLELLGNLNGLPHDFGDKPDLVISEGPKRLGVEHTRLYVEQAELPSGRQFRPQERIHFQIAERAFEIFRNKHSIPLYLTVDFAEPYNYRKRDVEEVAAALSLAVELAISLNTQSLAAGQDVRIEAWRFQHLGLPFPRGVDSFHYQVVAPDRGFELWGPTSSYCVPHLSVSNIEARIAKKESLLKTYLTRCDECWLLMVTDVGWRSSHFDVPPELADHLYITHFERVFVMTITHRNLIELHTSYEL